MAEADAKSMSPMGRNPNRHPPLNSAPDGPGPVLMGEPEGSGGMSGNTSVKGKNGETFTFK